MSHAGNSSLQVAADIDFGSCPSSPVPAANCSSDDNESRLDNKLRSSQRVGKKGSKKSKHIPEIESLPEGVPVDSKSNLNLSRKPPPSPLTLHKDCSESDGLDVASTSPNSYNNKHKQYKLATTSVPNSPSKTLEFFSENGKKKIFLRLKSKFVYFFVLRFIEWRRLLGTSDAVEKAFAEV